MGYPLDVIVLDDEPVVGELLKHHLGGFYRWGNVHVFTEVEPASRHCLASNSSLAIFVVDMFVGPQTGLDFLASLLPRYPMAFQDSIIITGWASDQLVERCMEAEVGFLLEKPITHHALMFSVRSIVLRYMKFAKRLMKDQVFAQSVDGLIWDEPGLK